LSIQTVCPWQEEVFDEISQLVQSAMDGYRVCIFACKCPTADQRTPLWHSIWACAPSLLKSCRPSTWARHKFESNLTGFNRTLEVMPESGLCPPEVDLNEEGLQIGKFCMENADGQTGSGKTYTMLGTQDHRGVIPRAMEQLFKSSCSLEDQGWSFEMKVHSLVINDL
jgi:hypothetical protein